jgi:phosphatidylinositol glycan class Q protein
MFHQYFQMGHRIRKHYLAPRVLLCLLTGKFVPPLNRKVLYSLQYSMLPARRAGVVEMWNAVNSLPDNNNKKGVGTGAGPQIQIPVLANGKMYPSNYTGGRSGRGYGSVR